MRWFRLTLLFIPILAWAYLAAVQPRPFYLAEDDPEHMTLYTSKLITAGRPPYDLHTPGLTTAYLAAASRYVGGLHFDMPQALLTWTRFLSAVVTGLALYGVVGLNFSTTPIGVIALALAPILAWPSFLLYFDYFDPNPLQLPLGLLAIAFFWTTLTTSGRPSLRRLGLCGVLLGVCLATKFTFVPLAAAMVAATAIRGAGDEGSIIRRTTPLIVLVVATAATFLALAAPVIAEFPMMLQQLVFSDDIQPRSWRIDDWLTAWRGLIALNAPAALVILGSAAVFCVQLIITRPTDPTAAARAGFLIVMLVGLAYTMAGGDGTAYELRKAQPTALCVPFLVVYCFDGLQHYRDRLTSPALQAAFLAIAVWVVAPPVVQRARERWVFVESHAAAVDKTRARLLSLKRPGTRVAVWDGSPGALLGEESFHFWGNYKYAGDTFDEELLGMYPDFALFRLREVPRIVHGESGLGVQVDPQGRAPGSGFGWPGWLWWRVFPRGDFKRNDEIVAGELSGVQVSVVALPEDEVSEELGESVTEPELVALIAQRFGPAVLRRESIAGVRWMLIEVAAKAMAQDR